MTQPVASNGLPSPWTDERVELCMRLYRDGLSASQSANRLGVSRNAIIGKWHRLGLNGRPRHAPPRPKNAANKARSATQRIKTVKVRAASNGGPVIVESTIWEPVPGLQEFNQAIPLDQRRTLFELTDDICKFPCGDPGRADFFFCGAVIVAKSYCIFHYDVAYRKPGSPLATFRSAA